MGPRHVATPSLLPAQGYSLSGGPAVAVALLDVGLVALVPQQVLQVVGEEQLPLALLLGQRQGRGAGGLPLATPPLGNTHVHGLGYYSIVLLYALWFCMNHN